MTGAPPSDYRLAVPSGWFRIALDPELREKRIAAFVKDRFRGIDNVPQRRIHRTMMNSIARAPA